MDEDIGLQRAIYFSLQTQRGNSIPSNTWSGVAGHTCQPYRSRVGKRNALMREGIMPTIPRSTTQERVDSLTIRQLSSPHRHDWVGLPEDSATPEALPLHLRPSDRIPGWTLIYAGGHVRRQNNVGSQLVLIGAEVHDEQTIKVDCCDLLLLRAVAPLPNSQGASCFTAQVHSLVSPGHYAMFAMGVTPSAGEEKNGLTLVVVHFDSSGASFISVERWRITDEGVFERLQVLEPMKLLRLIRGRVTLSLVITSQYMELHINGEVLYPLIDAPGVVLGTGLPIFLSTGGKLLVRDLAITEGDKPPATRSYGKSFFASTPPKKNTYRKRGLKVLEEEDEFGQTRRTNVKIPSSPSSFPQEKQTVGGKRRTNFKEKSSFATGGGGGGNNNSLPPGIIPEYAERIEAEIIEHSPNVQWEDIAGIPEAKRLLQEAVILPLLVPELFTGVVQPWKGVLLFGPPGTGKTMLARAVATSAKTTFFNISASSLISRYFGESEKIVRTLFQLARHYAPSTIFFDEIDALMSARGGNEHEASRRVKSEMLQQIDGLVADKDKRVMVLATTNRPWDLDEAMRRRLEKRIYIPLPDHESRVELLTKQTAGVELSTDVDLKKIAGNDTEGFSGADLNLLVRDAVMMPMRRLIAGKSPAEIAALKERGKMVLSALTMKDFEEALRKIQPSVSQTSLKEFETWAEELGSV